MKIVTNTTRGAIVAILLGGAVLAGTGSAHAAAKDCDLGFMPLKPTVGVGTVIGSAWASCDMPPEQHEMHLALDYREGGQWQGVEMISDDRIPTVARMSYIVKARCQPGYWRIEAEVVGTLQGRPFKFAQFSMPRSITAADCARGDR